MGEVFTIYSENERMSAEGLLKFLHTEQGDVDFTLDDAKQIMERIRKDWKKSFGLASINSDLSKEAFRKYLMNPDLNGVLHNVVHQDMTQPMSHYFIFTGHNSYLTGNQLSSDSSDTPIAAALRRGVRVVELDLWPDDKGGMKVTHGNTLTNPVSFQKCVTAIKNNAFFTSEYPVCVTIEDHLTSELQGHAAEILEQILGDALYYPPTTDALVEFPSPESLKRKIIISTKPPKEYLEACSTQKLAMENRNLVEELEKEDKLEQTTFAPLEENHILGENTPSLRKEVEVLSQKEMSTPAELNSRSPSDLGEATSTRYSKSNDGNDNPKHFKYARLITIRLAKHAKGTSMEHRLQVDESVKRISLSESKLEKVVEKWPEALVKFTQKNILRVYPAANRVNSSNFCPTLAWNYGAQMVAQNMQGYGKELWQAFGKFKGNGGCGYVLKPQYLLENLPSGVPFNPTSPRNTTLILKIKVMTTLGWDKAFSKRHFDLFSPPDFFTRVIVVGVPADEAKWKTSVVDNSWAPHWNEDHEFALKCPELALLRIEVRDHDDDSKDEFEGQTCLPIHEVRDGYRCVQMYDKKGNVLKGVLMLFHFQKCKCTFQDTAPISS